MLGSPTLLTDYPGRLVNHVEILYQPGERELAKRFFEFLGCSIVDTETDSGTGSSILYVYPEPTCQDRLNNVIYLSEIRPPQREFERLLNERLADDDELRAALDAYDHKARNEPHGITHFGLRYPSFDDIEVVIGRVENDLPDEMRGRVEITPIRPGDPRSMTDELIQAFVRTDIVCAGLFPLGQLIELQAQRVL
ncbi:MAG: hypothetical protein KDB21_11615 [Acidimicrobiales bacterium]|nr:hypothetical protein [Acidimicrobiales bacterium]